MGFKLVIKHCAKLDSDLVQNCTGPCSLTRHPSFCPVVPFSGCLLSKAVRQVVTSCCLPGCLPPGELRKPWKSDSFASPAFLPPLSPERDESGLGEASSLAGPACRAWEEVSAAPASRSFSVSVTRAIPRHAWNGQCGPHACYTHGSGIDPTLIFSTSLHGPRTPLLAAKYQVDAHFFCLEGLLFSSTCLSSAPPSRAWEAPLPMQCLPRFAFFLCAQSVISDSERSLSVLFLITMPFPQKREDPAERAVAAG